ncbi:hypothetical protein [Fibrella aquatica]|uniref:hypothetical protein n=1 Tax=Fibrella aquatica TaxID=3242487 RepID=UPI003520518F
MTIRIDNTLLKVTSLALLVDELKACNRDDLQILAMPIPEHPARAFVLTLSAPVLALTPLFVEQLKRLDLMLLNVTSRRSGSNCVIDYMLVDLSPVAVSASGQPQGLITDMHKLKEGRDKIFIIMNRFLNGEQINTTFALADQHQNVAINSSLKYRLLVGDLIVAILGDIDKETARIRDQMDGL